MTRLEKIKTLLPEGSDGLLVCSQKNIRYLTGFNFTDGYALVTRARSYVLTDFRYIEAAKTAVGEGWDIVMMTGGRSVFFKELLESSSVRTLCYEDRNMTCAAYNSFVRDLEPVKLLPAGGLIEGMREYKDAGEIENILKAQRIAEAAFEHILGFITPDRTETEVALELEYFMRKNGASAASFDTIAVSGAASSRPHGEPREAKLERGFLTLDFGALYNGYCSDMTRTVCIGRADSEMKRLYKTVLAAQAAALEAAGLGKGCVDIDRIARDIIDKAGYVGRFGHGLGHGVGMDIHEAPSLSPGGGAKTLGEGHVVTVEPGIYIEGKYGVRIEDMIAVQNNGVVNLTRSPKNLIEL